MEGLGKRIRDLRKAKRITLVEMAKTTGVAQASLSRIETGIMTGTVESHRKIAEAIGITLSELYEGLNPRHDEIDHATPAADKISLHTDSVKLEMLTLNPANKKMVPILYTLAPGCETKVDKLERGIERFAWALEGNVTVAFESTQYELKAKHSLYFDAALAHRLKNTGSTPAQVLCITTAKNEQ